jgi:uncharacterized membrane protein YhaH (DUF805 family)
MYTYHMLFTTLIYMVLIVNFLFWRTSQDTNDFGAIKKTILVCGMGLAE